jgi:hypothetical protein
MRYYALATASMLPQHPGGALTSPGPDVTSLVLSESREY